jgi:uncharacterized protein (TIGR04255 family)
MGKLTHAPVFYVVAQVTHSPILKLDARVPDLQELLRKEGFPGYRVQRGIAFQIEAQAEGSDGEPQFKPVEVAQHIFTSRDATESFVVGTGGFAYQTVEYDTYDAFVEKFTRGMRAIEDVLSPDSFTRIGLRFLDAVTPPEGGKPSTYIRNQFLGLQDTLDDDEDWKVDHTFSETLLTRQDQHTKVRVITRSSALSYPLDLVQTAPPLPPRFAKINGVHALLDSDASFTANGDAAQEFNGVAIIARLSTLKRDIRDSFNAVVTENALKDWT